MEMLRAYVQYIVCFCLVMITVRSQLVFKSQPALALLTVLINVEWNNIFIYALNKVQIHRESKINLYWLHLLALHT